MRALVGSLLFCAACAAGPVPCTTPGTCPEGQECLANRCVAVGGDPVPAYTRRLVLRPSSMALLSSRTHQEVAALPPAITFGSQVQGSVALYLRFEPAWRSVGKIESAFLLLDPMAGTLPSTDDVEIEVWRVKDSWKPDSLTWLQQPSAAPPQSSGLARTNPPSTLRIDVTEIIQHLHEHPRADHGMVLKAAGDGPHGASFATGTAGGRGPRLELYVR